MQRSRVFRLSIFFLCLLHCICTHGEENFLLVDAANTIVSEMGPHVDERLTPASTFKIALSLMGYDAHILQDTQTPVWDYKEGYDDWLASWKGSHTPASWMAKSPIWYSKLLALALGLEKMQNYLALFDYGNRDLSGGLTQPGPENPAWINSSLKISSREQVAFLQKLLHHTLPVTSHAVETTQMLLFKEELPNGWKLYGKTGTSTSVGVRWFVGWIQKDHLFYPFAYNIRAEEIHFGQTIPRVKQLIIESNIIQK